MLILKTSNSIETKDATIMALQDKVAALQAEAAGLQASQNEGDFKYKTVVEFFAGQHRIIGILSTLFAQRSACQDRRQKREIGEEINNMLKQAERIVRHLGVMVPGMDKLIADQGDGRALLDWIERKEHFQNP